MHPISEDEAQTVAEQHYPLVRMLVSPVDLGINLEGEVLAYETFPGTIPANLRGILAIKPTVKRVLGYEPLISATVNADLDNPVMDATITLNLGRLHGTVQKNLSPYMSGPSWDWSDFEGAGAMRPLFDAGIYVQLEGKLVSRTPRIVVPEPPRFVSQGPAVSTSGDVTLIPQWGAHVRNDIGILVVVTANQAASITLPSGFTEFPNSPQSTGTAGAAGAVRVAFYWARATSNAMAPPNLTNPGDHVVAKILVWRGCIETGNPFDVNPTVSVQSTSDTSVEFPAITTVSEKNRIIHLVAGATDTTDPQFAVTQTAGVLTPMTKRSDTWRQAGNGGGFAIADGINRRDGSIGTSGGGTGSLVTATAQARVTIALKPPPTRAVVDNPDDVPWRPFFTGRIDSADPAADNENHLVLRCRDLYADVLDSWITAGSPTDSENIETLLADLLALRGTPLVGPTGILFSTIGDPNMVVPEYYQEPMSVLLAMRQAGLQNGWDLRGRWGTAPYGEDQYVLTYYEPDRLLEGSVIDLPPARYFGLGSMGKSRDEVRNHVRVTPSDPPRAPANADDLNSAIKYGSRFLGITEDATSLITTLAQAQHLANAILSDTKEPKTTAEVEMRFWPWAEIGDVVRLMPNNVHHDTALTLAVSGFTHTLVPKGISKTVLRTRGNPAAANREWRRTIPKLTYVSPDDPAGMAHPGARWLVRRD